MSTLVAQPAIPTPAPGAISTIVVQTAQAAATQTAALLPPTLTPTFTPPPTRTATITPSPTATFLFLMATLTKAPVVPTLGTPSTDLACTLLSQSPEDNSTLSKNQVFTASWQVQNSGSTAWDANNVDFIYLNGAKLASSKAADLPKSVSPGEAITLKISMVAPSDNGSTKTVWTLRQGKTQFCHLSLTVVVR